MSSAPQVGQPGISPILCCNSSLFEALWLEIKIGTQRRETEGNFSKSLPAYTALPGRNPQAAPTRGNHFLTNDEGSGALEETERIVGHQVRLTRAIAIAAVIVLMSALLAFITVPPQPTVLLLGIFLAVFIYWVARTTGGVRFPQGGPHDERTALCANCGFQYAPIVRNAARSGVSFNPAEFLMWENRSAQRPWTLMR